MKSKLFHSLALALLFAVPNSVMSQDIDTPLTKLAPVHYVTSVAQNTSNYWNWTQPAEYHEAIVRVVVADGSAGTGAIVEHSGNGVVVITNAHVVGNFPSATIKTSVASAGMQVLAKYDELDLAILYTENASAVTSLPIGAYVPQIGSDIEICGFGGPQIGTLRHFSGKLTTPVYQKGISVDTSVINGDSGSPMIDSSTGAIIGVNFGGPSRYNNPLNSEWSLVYPSCSNVTGPQLAQLLTQVCSPYGCQPRIIYGNPGGQGQFQPSQPQTDPLYPPQIQPQPSQPQPIQPQIQPQPPQPVAPPQAGEKGEKGDKGDKGDQGEKGDKGDAGSINEEQLMTIIGKISSELKNDPSMKGQKGDKGEKGDKGDTAQITDEQLEYVINAVVMQLKTDPEIRGPIGPQGPPGTGANVDIDSVAKEVMKRLPPIRAQWIDKDNKVIDEADIYLGETMPLRIEIIRKLINASNTSR